MDLSYCRSSQVVLFGFSAGAIGTEANCDMVADTLHAINPDIKVTCMDNELKKLNHELLS